MTPPCLLLSLVAGNLNPFPLAYPDAAVPGADGGVELRLDTSPDISAIGMADGGFVITWASDRRQRAFDKSSGEADVWVNVLRSDGGLAHPFGALVQRAGFGEVLSQPRLTRTSGDDVVLAWRRHGASNQTELWWGSLEQLATGGRLAMTESLHDGPGNHTSLELASGPGQTLAVWETSGIVRARFRGTSTIWALNAASGSTSSSFRRPRVVANDTQGFLVVWQEAGRRLSQSTTLGFAELPWVATPGARFFSFLGPSQTMVSLGEDASGSQLVAEFRGPLVTRTLPSDPATPPIGVGRPERALIAYRKPDGGADLASLRPNGPPGTLRTLDLQGYPGFLAMAAGATEDLVVYPGAGKDDFAFLRLAVMDPSDSIGRPTLGIARAPDELAPSAAWLPDAGWVLGHTRASGDGALTFSNRLTDSDTERFVVTLLQPGERAHLVTHRLGARVGLHIWSDARTRVQETERQSAGLVPSASVRLEVTQRLPHATFGEFVAAGWATDGRLIYQVPVLGPRTYDSRLTLGRCGGWDEAGVFWLPGVDNEGFHFVRVFDAIQMGAPREPDRQPWSAPDVGSSPCAAVQQRRVAVVSESADRITLHLGDLDEPGARVTVTVTQSGVARQPVVAPLPDGWFLAWEDVSFDSTVVRGARVAQDGSLELLLALSDETRDARNPFLATTPPGALPAGVFVTWQEFEPGAGHSRQHFTRFIGLPDGSVEVVDAGAVDGGSLDAGQEDGGAEADGGMMSRDGGSTVPELVEFSSCGCAADVSLGALALTLLALRRRRR